MSDAPGPLALEVAIVTRDEGARIAALVERAASLGPVRVYDWGSEDDTVVRAREAGAAVEPIRPRTTIDLWEAPLQRGERDWVLVLEGGERPSSGLVEELASLAPVSATVAGYEIPTRTRFLERWIAGGSLAPGMATRLLRRTAARAVFDRRERRARYEVDGVTRELTGAIEREPYPDLGRAFARVDRESDLWAAQLELEGARAGWREVALRPLASFLASFLLRGGFRDGRRGFVLAGIDSARALVRAAKLWERHLPEGLREVPSNPDPP